MIVKFKFILEDYDCESDEGLGKMWHDNKEKFILLYVKLGYQWQLKKIREEMSKDANKDILVLSWPSEYVMKENRILRKIISGKELIYFEDHLLKWLRWHMKEVWIYQPKYFVVQPTVPTVVDFKYFIKHNDSDFEEYEQLWELNKHRMILLDTDLNYTQQYKKIHNEIKQSSKDIIAIRNPTELVLNRNKILKQIKEGRGFNNFDKDFTENKIWLPKEVWIYNPIIPDFFV